MTLLITPHDDTYDPPQELNDGDFATADTRREFPRRAARWLTTIKTIKGHILEGTTHNVSKEGVMIALPLNLPLGDKCFIEASVFYQGSSINLQAVAIVKHSSINGSLFNIGFQFAKASERTTQFLEKYASRQI